MSDQRTTVYVKQPNGRYRPAGFLDDPSIECMKADGLWIVQRTPCGQSQAHVCALSDLPSDMLNAGRYYAQRDAIVEILREGRLLGNYELASRIVEHFAKC